MAVDLSKLLPDNRKTLNPFGAVAGNREAPAPAAPTSSIPYAPTEQRTPDDLQARIDALSAQNQPMGLPSFTVPDQYANLNPVKAAVPQAPVQSPTTVPAPYSPDVYGRQAQTTFVQPSEPARTSGIKTAKERAKYSILQAFLNDPRQDSQSKQSISDALQSGTSPDEFVTALKSNGYAPQVDENSLAEAEQISKSMFKDEGEAFKRLVNDGMSVDDAHSTINQRWNEALGQTTEDENAQLEKLREDGVSAASAIKNIQKRRIDEKWANEHPFKNFAEGVLDIGAGAASLAMEQVGNVAGFLGSDYGQQFAQETKEATAETGLAGGTGYQTGRNVLGLGESVAAAPSSWATEAGMAKTIAGRAGQGAAIGAYQGAAEPILEKGADVTAEEIATGGAKGAGMGAVAVPVFEKGIQYAGTALSKGVREAGKELAGDVTGMFKKTPEVPVSGETSVEGAATPAEMAAVEKVQGKTAKAVFNGKEVEIQQPETGIKEFVTTPFREKDTKVLAGRAIAPRSVGVNKNPKQKAKLLANTEKDATEFHSQIRSGELQGEIGTLEETAQTIMKNLDDVGDRIGKAIDGLGDEATPRSSGLADDTLSRIDDVLVDEIQSDAAAFPILQKFRQRVDQAKTWKQVQAVKKNYQAELNKLLRNNEAGTEAYAALQKGVQDLTKSIEDAVETKLPDAEYGKLKSQYGLLKRLAGDVAQSALVESRRAPQTLVEQLSYLDALTNPLSFAKQQLVKEVAELNTRGGSWKELVKILDKRGIERAKNFVPDVVPEGAVKPAKTEISPVSGTKKPPEEPPTPPKGGNGGPKIPKKPAPAPKISIAKDVEKANAPKVPVKKPGSEGRARKAIDLVGGKSKNEAKTAPKTQGLFASEKALKKPDSGWTKLKTGEKVFEITDENAVVTDPKKVRHGIRGYGSNVDLKDVIKHDALFEQYPELADTVVKFNKTNSAYVRFGEINMPDTYLIKKGDSYSISDKDDFRSTLIHEIQHVIQGKEDLPVGGDYVTARAKKLGKQQVVPEMKKELQDMRNAIKSSLRENPRLRKLVKEYDALKNAEFKNMEEQDAAYDKFWNDPEFSTYMKSVKAANRFEKEFEDVRTMDNRGAYRRLIGEVQARNAQTRRGMSERERIENPPESTEDFPRREQIADYKWGKKLTPSGKIQLKENSGSEVADKLSDLKSFSASRAELMAEKEGANLGDVNKALVERGYVLKSGLGGDNWVKTETAGKFKGKEGIFAGIKAKNAPKSDYTGWTRESGGKLQFEISDKEAKIMGLPKAESSKLAKMMRDAVDMKEIEDSMVDGVFKNSRDAAKYAKLERSLVETLDAKASNGKTYEQILSDFTNAKTLGEVLDHPELYRQYPELKDVKFHYNSIEDKLGERQGITGGAVYVEKDGLWDEGVGIDATKLLKDYEGRGDYAGLSESDRLKSGLIHEIQHAIQTRENFARGGNPASSLKARDAAMKENEALIRTLQDDFRKMSEDPKVIETLNEMERIKSKMFDAKNLEETKAADAEFNEFYKKNEGILEPYRKLRGDVFKHQQRQKTLMNMNQYEAYEALGGEEQARNAQKRMNLTDKERAAKSPEDTETWNRLFQISNPAGNTPKVPGKNPKINFPKQESGLSGLKKPSVMSSELPSSSPAEELSALFTKTKDVVEFYKSKQFRRFEELADEMVKSLPASTFDMTPEQVKTFRQWNALKNKIRDVYSAVREQSAKDRSYARDLRADGTEGDLVALHNLGIDKIKKIRELGGLPGPSIGITKKSIPFEDFGDITLVGNRELVESLDAATYDADIYSPRVPSHTLVDKPQYRTNEARKALEERLAKAEKKYPWRKTSVWNVVEGARESDARNLDAQLLFASENGIKVEPVRSIPEGLSFYNKAVISNNVPIEKLAKYLPAKVPENNDEFTSLMLDLSKKIIRDNGLEENVLNSKKYDQFGFADADRMYSYLKSLKRVIEEGVPVDVHDTTRNLRDIINQKGLSEKFERFYSEIADEFFDKKLFKGFTYSGGKKFEDYTMDNIIREMFKSGAKGTESGQFSGNLSQTLGKNAKKLGLEGIRKMKFDKLDSEYSKLKDRWNSIVGWNNKEAIDVEFNPSKSAEWNADRIGNGFSEEDAQELLDIYKDARKLPRSYIETKFKRAVKLSEFKAVIAPKDKVKELKELLKGTGLEDRIVSYDPAIENRNSKLDSVRKKFGSIFFSQGGALIPAAYVINEAMKQNGQGEGR